MPGLMVATTIGTLRFNFFCHAGKKGVALGDERANCCL